MCAELLDTIRHEAYSRGNAVLTSQVPIKITNNKGYNYGGGECIIIGRTAITNELWKSINLEKSSFYREIVKVEPVMLPCYDVFNAEAQKLCASTCTIDRDTIFSALVVEGAMPKWEPTNNKMKVDNVNTAASTSTNITETDKWKEVATAATARAAEVFLNGDKVSDSCSLYTQANSMPEFSARDQITTNGCGWPDYTYKPTPISKDTTNWGNYGTSTIPNGISITTNTTVPIGIGLNTSKLAVNNEKKEDKNMFENIMKDFKFGPATDVKFSIYGPAFNGGDRWLARHEGEWVDVSDMLIDISGLCYMMPVAKSMVKEGDFILHKTKWARVDCVVETDNYISVEKINEQEVVQILPTKNVFGFDYYTKLICPIDGFEGAEGFGATTDNPFGMLPFIMAMKDGKKDNLLPFMMMGGKMDMSNPMMLMMLGGDNSNLGLMMAMMAMKKKDK